VRERRSAELEVALRSRFGGADISVEDHGESTDQNVANFVIIQCLAEREEVFELRRA
jgi:hypothetical protein